MNEAGEKTLKVFSIGDITTTNVGNFGMYRGEVKLIDQDGRRGKLSDFINNIDGFEAVTVDTDGTQGTGIHYGDIVGAKMPGIINPRIVKDKMKKLLVEELIKQDYVSIDGKNTYRFERAVGLNW